MDTCIMALPDGRSIALTVDELEAATTIAADFAMTVGEVLSLSFPAAGPTRRDHRD